MKAKLAYLCSSMSWGGLEMNHVRNARWMQDRGHDVCFICVKGSPISLYAEEKGLPTHFIQSHRKYYDFSKGRQLVQFLKQHSFTHLLIRSTSDMSIAAFVKHRMGNAIHTSYFMEMQLGVTKKNVLHTLRFKHIDLWSCPLRWLQEQVREMTNFKNELVVIPSGLELSQFAELPSKAEAREALNLPTDKQIFGLIGRFDPQKGQVLLLNAMQAAHNKDFIVAFLGEPTLNEGNSYFDEMNTIIQQAGLHDRVFIRPFRKDVGTFFAAIDWFVMATKAETFGMVTIESMACGTPVLGSNAGGTPELLIGNNEQAGLLFETQNPSSLASVIDKICDEKIHFDGESLKKGVERYDHVLVCAAVEKALHLTR